MEPAVAGDRGAKLWRPLRGLCNSHQLALPQAYAWGYYYFAALRLFLMLFVRP